MASDSIVRKSAGRENLAEIKDGAGERESTGCRDDWHANPLGSSRSLTNCQFYSRSQCGAGRFGSEAARIGSGKMAERVTFTNPSDSAPQLPGAGNVREPFRECARPIRALTPICLLCYFGPRRL